MSDEIYTKHITKFDGTDFQAWKFQVTQIFVANGILDIVDGTKPMPEAARAAEAKIWTRDNARAMFIISSSIDAKQLRPLLTCTSAYQMWVKLGQIYEQKSATNKLILTQRFNELRMDSNETVVGIHFKNNEHGTANE